VKSIAHTRPQELKEVPIRPRISWSSPSLGKREFVQLSRSFRALAGGRTRTVTLFERALSKYLGSRVISVNNGTSAILASLIAVGVSPGDRVVAPTYTFASVVGTILTLGAKPILVDSEPETFNMDPTAVEHLVRREKNVKALIHVDVSGVPGDLDYLSELSEEHGFELIEDAAEGLGTEYKHRHIGSFPHLTTFSFHPAKQMTTIEGGAIATSDESLSERAKLIVNHGMANTYEHVSLGLNFRLTDLQAAIGIAQLSRLDLFLERRRAIATQYTESLSDMFRTQSIPEHVTKTGRGMFLLLASDGRQREKIIGRLSRDGIEARRPWKPVHMQPFYSSSLRGRFPIAEDIYERVIAPPLTNLMSEDDVYRVIERIRGS